jgi:hypothetical protein
MKFLIAVLIALMFSSAAAIAGADAPAFPWRTYSAIPQHEAMPAGFACEGDVQIVSINPEWKVFTSEAKDLFIHYPTPDGPPDYAYFATGQAGGAITIHRVLSIEQAKRLYADPCAYFSEKDA